MDVWVNVCYLWKLKFSSKKGYIIASFSYGGYD